MGFMNPYVGLKRDDSGYYLDYNEASASPFYKQYDNGARLQAANQGGRVELSSFDPYTSQAVVELSSGGDSGQQVMGTPYGPVGKSLTDNRFKSQAFGRADQQYASDKEVAQIAQDGRDATKRAQLSSEIAYAQDATRRAAQDSSASGTDPGGPDVNLNTGGPATEDEGGDSNGNSRRRRGAYQGAGLKI